MAKHRNDVPNSVNIIKLKAATRQQQKVLPFFLEDFWAKNNSDRSGDNKWSWTAFKVSQFIDLKDIPKLFCAI